MWVIVDDGSDDQTWQRIRQFVDRHGTEQGKLIVHRSDENRGQAAARNLARSLLPDSIEWIHFMDVDDQFLQGGLNTRMHHADGAVPEIGMMYSRLLDVIFDHVGRIKMIRDMRMNLWCDPRIPGHEHEYLKKAGNFTVTGAGWVRSKAFDEAGGFSEGLVCGEDGVLWEKISEGWEIKFLGLPTHVYGSWPEERKTYRQHRDLLYPKAGGGFEIGREKNNVGTSQ